MFALGLCRDAISLDAGSFQSIRGVASCMLFASGSALTFPLLLLLLLLLLLFSPDLRHGPVDWPTLPAHQVVFQLDYTADQCNRSGPYSTPGNSCSSSELFGHNREAAILFLTCV